MLKIGVIGAGHLGKIHLKCLLDLAEHYHLVGLYDIDPDVALAASQQFGIPAFATGGSGASKPGSTDHR